MQISVSVESDAWQKAIDLLLAASREQARQASLEGAEAIRDAARDLLHEKEHPWDTFSPSAPGEPPASLSDDGPSQTAGALADSMDARLEAFDEAWVGPTAGYGDRDTENYARIQELGGLMEGDPMRFFVDDTWWEANEIFLEPRPYLAPATDDVVDSGRLTGIYQEHQLIAIREATG